MNDPSALTLCKMFMMVKRSIGGLPAAAPFAA
jgi:hypothetical protein